MLKEEVPVDITWKLNNTFDSVNKAVTSACELALKQRNLGKHLVWMTDTGFKTAGYALMIEDNLNQKI